jgi:hypothetical protein
MNKTHLRNNTLKKVVLQLHLACRKTSASIRRKQTLIWTHFFDFAEIFGGDFAFIEKLTLTKFQVDISNGVQMHKHVKNNK